MAFACGFSICFLGIVACIAYLQIFYLIFSGVPDAGSLLAAGGISIALAIAGMLAFFALIALPAAVMTPICWHFTARAFAFAARGSSIATGQALRGYNPELAGNKGHKISTIAGVIIGYAGMIYGWIFCAFGLARLAMILAIVLTFTYLIFCGIAYPINRITTPGSMQDGYR